MTIYEGNKVLPELTNQGIEELFRQSDAGLVDVLTSHGLVSAKVINDAYKDRFSRYISNSTPPQSTWPLLPANLINKIAPDRIEELMGRLTFGSGGMTEIDSFVHAYLDCKLYLATGHSRHTGEEHRDTAAEYQAARDDALRKARDKLIEFEGYALYLRVSNVK